jgi:hypothetical protein
MDDSDGYLGGILEKLQAVHLAACKQAKADPVALARRLFAWELGTSWGTFYGAAATYADVLGQKGLGDVPRQGHRRVGISVRFAGRLRGGLAAAQRGKF